MLPDKDKVVRVMNYEKYRGNDIDQWLVIQAMLITNSDIHWVRHACHHYRESYERLNRRPSMTLESRKQFERVHRTLVMYVYGGLTIQKAWSAAGEIVECLYCGISVEVLERVLEKHYGLRPVVPS